MKGREGKGKGVGGEMKTEKWKKGKEGEGR